MHWDQKPAERMAKNLVRDGYADRMCLSPAYAEDEEDQLFANIPMKYNVSPANVLYLFSGYDSFRKAEKQNLPDIHCLKIQNPRALREGHFNRHDALDVASRENFQSLQEITEAFKAKILQPA